MFNTMFVKCSDDAQIHSSCKFGKKCKVGSSVIKKDCNIGNYFHLYADSYLGKNVTIGNNVEVGAEAIIHDGAKISNNVIINSKAIIERSTIGYGCEIGSISEVGYGCEIDVGCELCHDVKLGVNVKLGKDVTIYACSSIGNSTTIEDKCGIMAKSTVMNDVKIGSDCFIGEHSIIGDDCILEDDVTLSNMVSIKPNILIPSGTVVPHSCVDVDEVYCVKLSNYQKISIVGSKDGYFINVRVRNLNESYADIIEKESLINLYDELQSTSSEFSDDIEEETKMVIFGFYRMLIESRETKKLDDDILPSNKLNIDLTAKYGEANRTRKFNLDKLRIPHTIINIIGEREDVEFRSTLAEDGFVRVSDVSLNLNDKNYKDKDEIYYYCINFNDKIVYNCDSGISDLCNIITYDDILIKEEK